MAEGVTARIALLAGRYEIGEVIGRGGMATVHAGNDTRLGRRVAVKLLKPSLASDPAFRTRFRQEAQAAARMAHPTIVRVYDAGEETVVESTGSEVQVPFIVMEFVEGRPLSDIVADGALEPAEAIRITQGILTALEYSHRAGVVHRDIKPANVMVTPTGQVKVMDFGIARAITDTSATVAQTTSILGTASYFSPEQARGETVDARTDLYSTGIVLFELLAGRTPFNGDTPVAVAYQHVREDPQTPSTRVPSVSPALDAVTLHALAKDRTQRFQNAAEFRRDLDQAAAGQVPSSSRRLPSAAQDTATTLFGVNPRTSGNTEAAFRELDDTQEHRPQRTQNRPPVAWIWVGIVLTIAVIAAVTYFVANLQPGQAPVSSSVAVPDVSDSTWASAKTALRKKDLTGVKVDQSSNSVEEGRVIGTGPKAGTAVARHEEVQVLVSSGPAQAQVPDVSGKTQDSAEDALKSAGFEVGAISSDYSSTVPEGTVMSSSPGSGETHTEGTVVNLTVSNGKVQLPNMVGQQADAANAALAQLGLQVSLQPDDGCMGGAVSQQSVQPSDVAQGSAVVLSYCTATPPPVETEKPKSDDKKSDDDKSDDGK